MPKVEELTAALSRAEHAREAYVSAYHARQEAQRRLDLAKEEFVAADERADKARGELVLSLESIGRMADGARDTDLPMSVAVDPQP